MELSAPWPRTSYASVTSKGSEALIGSSPEGLVFPTESGKLRQQGKMLGRSDTLRNHYRQAGIRQRRGLHWHALRHTCATNLVTGVLGRRWSLEEVQVVMGHSSITITQRYAHVGEDAIKRAVQETIKAAGPEPVPTPALPSDRIEPSGLLSKIGRMFRRAA